MDGRTRIAFSGIAAFAVTATVIATVVTTNAVAFADTPGAAIGAPTVDVRPIATPTATPTVEAPAPESVPTAPAIEVVPETVPAPEPVVVVPAPAPSTYVPPPPAPVSDPTGEEALRAAIAAGDEEAVFAWAAAQGWSREKAEQLLSRWRDDRGGWYRGDNDRGRGTESAPLDSPVDTGSPAVTESPQRGDGSKRDRSHGSPDHRD